MGDFDDLIPSATPAGTATGVFDDLVPTYETKLTSTEETKFQEWKSKYAPKDSGDDYDLRGAFKAGVTPGDNGHWPDTFKKPNHPTFSDESIYAKDAPEKAGHWQGDKFIAPGAGAFDDLIPEPVVTGEDLHHAMLSQGSGKSLVRRIRESLTPLIGPTRDQVLSEGVPDASGTPQFRPMGGDIESKGFFPALSQPMVPIPRAAGSQDDSAALAAGKAVYNVGAGFGEFFESPLGVATAGIGALPSLPAKVIPITKEAIEAARLTRNLGRAVAGGYALDMAAKTPELAREAGELSVTGTTQQQVEADLGLGANVILPGTLGAHALLPGRVVEIQNGKSKVQSEVAPVSEFGGEAAMPAASAPAGTFDDLIPAEPIPAAAPAEAPRATSVLADKKMYPVIEVPVKELKLSEDVPNFKANANAQTGVVAGQQLEGDYERLGTGAVAVYERLDGSKEVISGRHRFDLAKRGGEETIPAQIVRESDGFTPEMAMTLDAEMNIRDGQGTVGDYANYFRNSAVSEAEARQRGLLSRAKGQDGWTLGRHATPDLYALYRAGKITEPQAVAIAGAAPGEAGLQRVGSQAALRGAGAQELGNFVQAVRLETKSLPPEQFDLFAADDSAIQAAEQMGKVASRIQGELSREIRATDTAARNATTAKAKGLSFERPPEEMLAENAQLKGERARWDNWALHPELVQQVRDYAAMKRAGEGAKAESAPAPKPTLEERLESLKIDTGGGKLLEGVTGLPIHLWNESINIIKLGVTAGKALAAAVEDGIAWLKANHPGSTFDAEEYRRAVDREFGVRAFGQKLQADPDVAASAKTGIAEYVYEKRENESDLQAAQRLVSAHGIDGGLRLYQDERVAMPGAVRTMLGKHLLKAIGAEERLARSRGDTAGADGLLAKQVDLADLDLKRSTDIAQSLQAMSVYGDLTPEGMLQHARRVFGDAAQRLKDKVQPVLDTLRGGFREANAQAVAGTIADPDVNSAARSAVDVHIAGSEATRRGVVAEVAGAFAESPEIVRQAREALRGQLNKLLQSRGPGVANPAKAALGDILGKTAQRAAGIAAGHYQGAELGKTLSQKLQERLGLSADAAGRLAKSLDLKFAAMVEAARKKIPERVAAMRARQAAPFDPNEFAQAGVDREIRRQLRELNLKLGDLVKRHGATVDATGRSIGERVVQDAGLTGPRAEALQKAFDQRFQELATAQKRRLVEALGRARVKLPRQVKSELGKLIELTNVGAFDDRRFSAELAKRLDLPEVTPDLAREITRRANDVQATPEGFQRDRASVRLLNFIAQQRGVPVWELPMAMWYANILSGVTTPVHVMADNLGGLAGNTLVSLLRQPGALGQASPALARGFSKGAMQSLEILKTGIVTGVKSQLHTSQTLELNPFRGPLAALNFWKYPGRVLAATHVMTFKPAMELKQSLVARSVARNEGLAGAALTQRVADLLANTDERVNAARAQAVGEGLTGLDLRRRTAEILEQQREQAMPGSTDTAREYALRATYLNEPYGAIGHVVKGLNTVIEGIGSDHGRLGFVPKLVVPFTRIIGNLINEKLNWSPVGAFRAVRAMQSEKLYGRPVTDETAVGDLLTKSIVGTAAMSALAAVSAQYLNDPDPKFAITGNGPAGPGARKQLEASGWRPHAVKLGGVYVDYLRSPLAVPLAVLGNYLDAMRYRHFDQSDALNRATFVLKGTADTIVHQSFLDSVAKLFEVVGNENTKTGGEQLARTLARGGAAFVVPNLVMQVDRLFDPTRYDDTGVTALVRAQLPFARRENKPVINVLGDPVKFGVFDRDVSATKPDALWRVLAEKQAWVPEPGRDTIVGDRKRGPDYFRALTPEELYDYTRESGQRIRDRLEANLDHIRDLEPDQAKAYVQQVTEEERARARKGYSP